MALCRVLQHILQRYVPETREINRRLTVTFGIKSARNLVVLIKHSLRHGVRRTVEPALRIRLGVRERPGLLGYRRVAEAGHDFRSIEADGDYRARADVGAAPLAFGAPERTADYKVGVLHRVDRNRSSS